MSALPGYEAGALTPALIIAAALLLLAVTLRLLGPTAPPRCPLCHSRMRKHAKSCPWFRRER